MEPVVWGGDGGCYNTRCLKTGIFPMLSSSVAVCRLSESV